MGRGNIFLGKKGERIALSFLARHGYKILDRNFKTPLGEIDIAALKNDFLVFIEVKTRIESSFGPAYLAVTKDKLRHIKNAALCYIDMKNMSRLPWQVDIVSIELTACGAVKNIEVFENVLEED